MDSLRHAFRSRRPPEDLKRHSQAAGCGQVVAEFTLDQHLQLAWETKIKAARSSSFCSLQTRAEATDSWGHVAPRSRWQDLCLDLPGSDGRASKKAIHAWKELISGMPIFEKRSKMTKTGRHVIQSWYLARISRSEMRMVTTCPRTKSPHESQLFYGSTTEFNGSDAAEKTTDPWNVKIYTLHTKSWKFEDVKTSAPKIPLATFKE